MTSPPTIDSIRRSLTARLAAGGIDQAFLDARMLIGAVLALDLTGLAAQGQRPLMGEELAAIEAHAQRRLAGEPVARILGAKEFWGLDLVLSDDTLVPRPDTETVVEMALALAPQARTIADLGTGSGAILLALLSELTDAHGIGTDINVAALTTARGNARRLGLAARAQFVACDYAAALAPGLDLIVSNPPYLRSGEIATLSAEVRDHDPRRALDGGPDGLAAYRVLAAQAATLLAAGGHLIVEVGHDQSDAVTGLLAAAGLAQAATPKADLAGIPRAVAARKMP